MYIKFGKRIFDIVISLILFILSLPIFAILCMIVWCDVGWPILFKQPRLGINGKEFGIIKFRTIQGAIHYNQTLSYDEVNKQTSVVGKWLRLHCCDEMLQFWNVLLGHMSIVGPRPRQYTEYTRYNISNVVLKKLLSVLPGITGGGQITMCKQFCTENWTPEHDLKYIDNISWQNDLLIILKTILIVIKGH
ncbi:MAG: sugar transferase [bacterium]|nr:sugar transferase [bacterium]